MRFRRHGNKGFRLGVVFEWIRAIPKTLGLTSLSKNLGTWIGPVGGRRRSRVVTAAALLTAFLLGYVVAVTLLFPAPFFPRSLDVPRLLGSSLSDAREELESIGLAVADTEYVSHPEAPSGRIVWQDPPPGVAVPEGARVTLSVSRGPRPIQVPDVTGYGREIAIRLIEAAGLTVARVDTGLAPVERGVVVRSNPPAGRSLNPGSGVGLFVSVGTPTIHIPDVTGLTVEEAQVLLDEAGLVLATPRMRTTNIHEPDLIFEQTPAGGTLSAPGAAVNVIVARGG
jgi:eukaryotic-like serine/threonine-protein kinase